MQLGQTEFHGHAAVVDFIDDEYVLAFQYVRDGVEPLDFFDFFRYLSFIVAVVIGGCYGVIGISRKQRSIRAGMKPPPPMAIMASYLTPEFWIFPPTL